MSAPDWLEVGAPVVMLTHGVLGGRIKRATVTKIGKRDVVLDTGDRFNVDRLERSNGSWDPVTHLVAPDDERVAEVRSANLKNNRCVLAEDRAADLRSAVQRHRRGKGTADEIRAAFELLTEALGSLLELDGTA